ncbi:serine/threonine-protein kinase, partial [Streptomyces sp. MUM 2J]|uniref:serine/threonine-protein kinase n=1 Tax=Streptomyces sp. MUM 2J TaxID=2791987 RepID=UPI0023D91A31
MGEVFAGRYELADPIGRGGVGAVWRAWDHRRRRYVAAKVLQQSDAHSLLRFVREQALRIDHPNVLAPASWAADDDKVLFTMDLVTGGSLVHLVGDYGPLPPAFVCTLLDQLLAGLAAVHAEGVVHRDVKPANVLLEATGTRRPRLRLSDFGIAMRLGEPRLTETNLVVGTPGYLAPEQMMGAEPDFPADLFAAGLVALYLLEGAKPDAKALIQHFAEHGTPGAPKGIPEPLWQVVAALLEPDPEARFRTATGARKALAAAAELLSEPGPDDELIEIFDQIGPLPPGFGPSGPDRPARRRTGAETGAGAAAGPGTAGTAGTAEAGAGAGAGGVEAGGAGAGEESRHSFQGSPPPLPAHLPPPGNVTGGGTGPSAGSGSGTGAGAGAGFGPGPVSGTGAASAAGPGAADPGFGSHAAAGPGSGPPPAGPGPTPGAASGSSSRHGPLSGSGAGTGRVSPESIPPAGYGTPGSPSGSGHAAPGTAYAPGQAPGPVPGPDHGPHPRPDARPGPPTGVVAEPVPGSTPAGPAARPAPAPGFTPPPWPGAGAPSPVPRPPADPPPPLAPPA